MTWSTTPPNNVSFSEIKGLRRPLFEGNPMVNQALDHKVPRLGAGVIRLTRHDCWEVKSCHVSCDEEKDVVSQSLIFQSPIYIYIWNQGVESIVT